MVVWVKGASTLICNVSHCFDTLFFILIPGRSIYIGLWSYLVILKVCLFASPRVHSEKQTISCYNIQTTEESDFIYVLDNIVK